MVLAAHVSPPRLLFRTSNSLLRVWVRKCLMLPLTLVSTKAFWSTPGAAPLRKHSEGCSKRNKGLHLPAESCAKRSEWYCSVHSRMTLTSLAHAFLLHPPTAHAFYGSHYCYVSPVYIAFVWKMDGQPFSTSPSCNGKFMLGRLEHSRKGLKCFFEKKNKKKQPLVNTQLVTC